jgi:hypothetical protein
MKLIISETQLRKIISEFNPADFEYEDDEFEFPEKDPENFSPKLKHKEKYDKVKRPAVNYRSEYYDEKRDKDKKHPYEKKWSPIKSDDLPLDKYLEKKKKGI